MVVTYRTFQHLILRRFYSYTDVLRIFAIVVISVLIFHVLKYVIVIFEIYIITL